MPNSVWGEPVIQGITTGLLAFATARYYAPWWIAMNASLIVGRFLWVLLEVRDARA